MDRTEFYSKSKPWYFGVIPAQLLYQLYCALMHYTPGRAFEKWLFIPLHGDTTHVASLGKERPAYMRPVVAGYSMSAVF